MARKDGKDRGLVEVKRPGRTSHWKARLYHLGKEWRSKAVPTKTEARNIYNKKKAEFREAEYFPAIHHAKQAQRVTVADLMALMVADYRRQHRKTLSDAEEKARFWITLAGTRPAASMTGNQLNAWADDWSQKGLANSTINNYMSKLLRGYAIAKDSDPPLLFSSPKWTPRKPNPPRSGWMEWATFEQIRQALPVWVRVPVTFAFWTGMRMGEITHLTRAQIRLDPEQQRVALTLGGDQTKNEQARTIVWTGDLYDVVSAWEHETQRDYPWCPWICHRYGKKLRSVDSAWKSVCVKLHLATGTWTVASGRWKKGYWTEYRGPLLHDFRRTAARNLDRAGVSRDIARKITGHKTDSMYTRYNIVNEEDLVEAGLKVVQYVDSRTRRKAQTGQKPDDEKMPAK